MPAYILDLKADRDWIGLVERFKEILLEKLDSSLLKLVALYSPRDRVYDSNLLVVVEDDNPDVVKAVIDAVVEAEREIGVEGLISPLVVSPSERRIIEGFEGFEVVDELDKEDWTLLIRNLCRRIVEKIRPIKVIKLVALYSPRDRVYDSNLLVVVEDDNPDVVKAVIDAVVEAEREIGVEGLISPLVVSPSERRIIEGFEGFEVVCEQGTETS